MTSLSRSLFAIAGLAISAAIAAPANAQTSYSIQALSNLGTPLGIAQNRAYGLNENGMIVGQAYNPLTGKNQAVYWDTSGNIQTLNQTGIARAVNNSGVIVGETGKANLGTPNGYAFSWQQGGSITNLGALGGTRSGAFDINDAGVITGFAQIDPQGYTPLSHRTHAFKYENGVMTDLGTVSDPDGYSRGQGINDAGEIAGRASLVRFENSDKHMASWDSNGAITSNVSGVGNYSGAEQINNFGVIVGNAYDASADFQTLDRAAVWDGNGLHFLLGDVNDGFGLGGEYGRAWSINDDGTIVGSSFDNTVLEESIAMVSFDGNNMLNLNNLVDDLTGWSVLTEALDVNELGQIVGYGMYNGVETAFLLTPTAVPVPAAAWLFGSALGLLGYARRKKSPQ